jgi:hypothetical protein
MAARDTQEASGLTRALVKIIVYLRDEPPLLYGLGAGVLVVALAGVAGGIAASRLWLLVGALVVLTLAGLGAWLVKSDKALDRLRVGGSVHIRGRARALSDDGPSSARSRKNLKIGGNLVLEDDARLASDTIRSTSEPSEQETPRTPDSGS